LTAGTVIDFVSPQVDDQLQGILAKAPVKADLAKVRNLQQVKARSSGPLRRFP